ncbi:MFS transporter [Lacicoccus alkaliphilus]|uniref:Predicted arabinose efflux permease, MFS family n=1 Tax=Lacicoccus alkaliphilus DSM 16010 TaxID=1123231 RepID=A0A1M7J8J6_9BACL|nr:MFS transporter [Salinicoccus alkaliphilus]SHM49248.1 Predicted arabinose efflux permease, MFS family [Salinicoccus alkaliphilus DSM 16010]
MDTNGFKRKFIILSIIVCISGFSQGLLLPLISFIFEDRGISPALSGLHASGLYIGVFVSALFIEAPLRKYGYMPMIIIGGATVGVALFLFPAFEAIWFWFVLRLIVGVADNMLHFSTQTWLIQSTPPRQMGKIIAFYGLFFSFGFMIGPKVSELVVINEALPFIVSGVLTMIAWPLIFLLPDAPGAKPVDSGAPSSFFNTLKNFRAVIITSWACFLAPMLFGIFEGSLNTNFPVFALRNDFEISQVTWILPMFSFGAILLQVPIGILGDKVGRARLISALLLLGAGAFFLMEVYTDSFWLLMVLFALAGVFVGSMYSLGISYMADMTPAYNLPAGNLIAGMAFSIGSIIGPVIGGAIITETGGEVYFMFFVVAILIVFMLNIVYMAIKRNDVKE